MIDKMKVVYISTEMAPFAKSGELADVASALPKFLASTGLHVSVFLPLYRTPEIEALSKEPVADLKIPMGEGIVKGRIFKSEPANFSLFLVDNPKYFWRDDIYGTGKGDYLDNDERFTFFNRAVMEYLLHSRTEVDIIHCNSWPTALIPVFQKTLYAGRPGLKKAASLLTLHNVAYQGTFPPDSLALTGLNWNLFSSQALALNGKFNFLKAGVVYADLLNTISASYKKDITGDPDDYGLAEILRSRKKDFFVIRNGVDYNVWNPETDPFISARYSPRDRNGKKECKMDLLRNFGLEVNPQRPLIAVYSYLSKQKGMDLLLESIDGLMNLNLSLAVLGKGDEKYRSLLRDKGKRYKGRLALREDPYPALVHKLLAGADIYLMPSLYEPGGLNQLYCMKYGTVSVVHAIGGLEETVKPYNAGTGKGNGFVFRSFSRTDLLETIKEALDCFNNPDVWNQLLDTGFKENFSWEKAARQYMNLYKKAIAK